MGFIDWARALVGAPSGRSRGTAREISIEAFACAQEFSLRRLCYLTCVNLIANAIGKCELKTFERGKEVRGDIYYLWNVSPNTNENSTAFWHRFVHTLYADNEALIFQTANRTTAKGTRLPSIVVADSFEIGDRYPSRQNEYTGVTYGATVYNKTFREKDIFHFVLQNEKIQPVRDAVVNSYERMMNAAAAMYEWNNRQHLKVKLAQAPSGNEDDLRTFKSILENQVRPFFGSGNTVLPQYNGYEYSFFKPETGAESTDYTKGIQAAAADIWNTTAESMLVPIVLVNGKVEAVSDATTRFLSDVIDPICDQITEEITRKEYDYDEWHVKTYASMDSSAIRHFDMFEQAAAIEKLIGSGVFSVNDVRRSAGQPRIEEKWADAHYMTLNIGNLDNDGARVGNTAERREPDGE